MNNDMKIVSDMSHEMRLEDFMSRELVIPDKAIVTYKIENKKIQIPNKGIEKITFCIVIIEYNGVKHYSHFAYDKNDMLYFKENNINSLLIISKMINVILDTTNIPRDKIDTDNLKDFINEFEKFTNKIIK